MKRKYPREGFLNGTIGTISNGKYSTWRLVTSGIPQGSLMGPNIFKVVIYGLGSNINPDSQEWR